MSIHQTRRSAIRLALSSTVVGLLSSALGCSQEGPSSEYETKKGPSAEESVTRGRVPRKAKTQEPATVQRSKTGRE